MVEKAQKKLKIFAAKNVRQEAKSKRHAIERSRNAPTRSENVQVCIARHAISPSNHLILVQQRKSMNQSLV